MVRFIISGEVKTKDNLYNIYIPIWLDLLSRASRVRACADENLHSNMVRFIIKRGSRNKE